MKTDQIIEIARLYYEQNTTQEDIARQLSISRSTVARALRLAKERGYIRTVVIAPSQNNYDLENWLRDQFNIRHVIIVPCQQDPQQDLDSVGKAAAAYLDSIISEHTILALSGGRTLYAINQHLRPAQRPNLTVVPAMGGLVTESAISANEIVREVATKWQASAEALFAPATMSDATAREALLREDSIRPALQKAKSASLVCTGLAVVKSTTEVPRPYESSSGRVSQEDMQQLQGLGAVCEVCAQFLDIQGNEITSWNENKTIALSIADFKRMFTIVVGAGREKAPAFLAACRNGFISALFITEDLAMEIERLANPDNEIEGKSDS